MENQENTTPGSELDTKAPADNTSAAGTTETGKTPPAPEAGDKPAAGVTKPIKPKAPRAAAAAATPAAGKPAISEAAKALLIQTGNTSYEPEEIAKGVKDRAAKAQKNAAK